MKIIYVSDCASCPHKENASWDENSKATSVCCAAPDIGGKKIEDVTKIAEFCPLKDTNE